MRKVAERWVAIAMAYGVVVVKVNVMQNLSVSIQSSGTNRAPLCISDKSRFCGYVSNTVRMIYRTHLEHVVVPTVLHAQGLNMTSS